jgi:hypothetical protein
MPYYASLRGEPEPTQKRVAEGLIRLRSGLKASGVPVRTVSGEILIASWNIREFDSPKYGERLVDAFYYIAEVISHFDLVAVQEVNADLRALDRIQSILGGWWKYVVTDVTAGSGGANERMAFIYDSRTVAFGGLAGEIVLPPSKVDSEVLQFARTPFVCGFKSGWAKFDLCTVHIYYGDSKPLEPRRLEEIRKLADFLAKRAARPGQPARPDGKVTAVRNTGPDNLILLGDFNIFDPADATMTALTDAGFIVPEPLKKRGGSNIAKDKYYDQIAIWRDRHRLEEGEEGGVFDFYDFVFRLGDAELYAPLMAPTKSGKTPRYKEWRTHQMSDHLVLWASFKVDQADQYLQDLAGGEALAPDPE